MKRLASLAASAALLVASSFGAVAPASADSHMSMHPDHNREQAMVMGWCHDHPMDRDCHDWDHSHHHWSDSRYHDWYLSHHNMHGFDPGAALAFGFGAAIGAGIAHKSY